MKGDKLYLKIFSLFCFFIFHFDLKAKGIITTIRENPDWSIFYSYINNTELEATDTVKVWDFSNCVNPKDRPEEELVKVEDWQHPENQKNVIFTRISSKGVLRLRVNGPPRKPPMVSKCW